MRPLKLLRFLFSPFGRCARLPFLGTLAWCLAVSLLTVAVTAMSGGLDTEDFDPTPLGLVSLLVASALIMWPMAAGMSKRLHDLNLSAWLMTPVFVTPLTGLAQIVAMQLPFYNEVWDDTFKRAYDSATFIWPAYFLGLLTLLCLMPSRQPFTKSATAK